ncbi:hypothetical protein CONLIGDRAFT_677426 [Coniochaeta ligniaria NRRL 30616]|uniref:HTH myb-type domain-containing protein n=1 Tax=Coniochaeta ligniaria NRRL 30616 TaxID=1408157 RepID=A0A1J7JW76_9PEZI|nr:hypothetical protein CONLIGDRAFT_677426 [Coniochaeta ligniaria NRRL 30616]
MSIKERWQRLVSRKSLSSGHSSSSSNSDSCDSPPTPYSSSGTSTPSSTIPISTAPPALGVSASVSKTSPTNNSFQNSSSSFLSKTLTWRSSQGASSGQPKEKKGSRSSADRKDRNAPLPRRRIHPSERPLTEANLRQQEELSAFKWEFGRSMGRRNSLGMWSVDSRISPCCSRRGSLVPPPAA